MNVYGLGCYKWVWREDQPMHWTKNFNFLKKKLLRLLHISYIYLIRYKNASIIVVHNVIIIGTTVGCIFSASCSNHAFHASIFSAQQTFTTSYFRPTIGHTLNYVIYQISAMHAGSCGNARNFNFNDYRHRTIDHP